MRVQTGSQAGGVPLSGVPVMRITVVWGLCWAPPLFWETTILRNPLVLTVSVHVPWSFPFDSECSISLDSYIPKP